MREGTNGILHYIFGQLDVVQKMGKLAKERLTTEDIKNEMLLRTDHTGRNVWHIAANEVKLVTVQKVWDWAKERLTTDDIKMRCYYAQIIWDGTRGIKHLMGAN